MHDIQITDEFLVELTTRFDNLWLKALPEPKDCKHTFPDSFREKIISIAKRKQKLHTFCRRLVAAIIALLIGSTILIAINPDVRAVIKGWFLEILNSHAVYHFTDNSELTELPIFNLSYIPDNFEEIDGLYTSTRSSSFYLNPETGKAFVFEYRIMTEGNIIEIIGDNSATYEVIRLNDTNIYFYAAGRDSSTNNMIWFDNQNKIVFLINSDLEKDVMLHMAESVVLEDFTK